jgi:hypothetical protein
MAGPRRDAPSHRTARALGALPLWPWTLAAALLPALGVGIALALYVPPGSGSCNPFIQDCVSISRMGKHGVANGIFRALVLPGAVLQLLVWLVLGRALLERGLARRDAWLLAAVGALAAAALIVYTSFLGGDGDVYAWLRRRGTLTYFGGTYIAMLMFVRAARRLEAAGQLALPRQHGAVLVALLGVIAVLALLHGFASLFALDALEDRIENLTEWWGALAMTLAWAVMALMWRRWGLEASLALRRPGG